MTSLVVTSSEYSGSIVEGSVACDVANWVSIEGTAIEDSVV